MVAAVRYFLNTGFPSALCHRTTQQISDPCVQPTIPTLSSCCELTNYQLHTLLWRQSTFEARLRHTISNTLTGSPWALQRHQAATTTSDHSPRLYQILTTLDSNNEMPPLIPPTPGKAHHHQIPPHPHPSNTPTQWPDPDAPPPNLQPRLPSLDIFLNAHHQTSPQLSVAMPPPVPALRPHRAAM